MGLNGNVGNKNSGRKTIKEEVEAAKELITQDALIALANSKVYKQLKKIEEENPEAFGKTKEMALPITLKGIIERIIANNKAATASAGNIRTALGKIWEKTTRACKKS